MQKKLNKKTLEGVVRKFKSLDRIIREYKADSNKRSQEGDLNKKCGLNVTMSDCCNAPVTRVTGGVSHNICSKCKKDYYPPKYGK